MKCAAPSALGRPAGVLTPRRLRSRSHLRPGVAVAAWNPWMPTSGGFDQPEVPEERFRSLFACSWIPPSQNPHTVHDVRDAMEACTGLWGEERQECLAIFGVDAHKTDTFYSTVLSLEIALEQDTDPEEEASHRGQERC